MTHRPLGTLSLPGITALTSQPFGPLHLVPLVRSVSIGELPVASAARPWHADASAREGVALVPHGAVVGFDEGAPRVAFGTQLVTLRDGVERNLRTARMDYPLGRRDAATRVRMLPMHLTLEGLLLSAFEVRPEAWARRASVREYNGSVRAERSAASVVESALRTFELHAGQCGALLYAADTLLAAFVTPAADAYAELHRALVGDLLGGTMQLHLTRLDAAERPFKLELPGAAIRTLADLRLALARSREPWPTAVTALREGLAPSPLIVRASTRAMGFTTRRFTTGLVLGHGNAIGEVVHRDDGAVAWLSYVRLSEAQTRRAFLLSQFAAMGWSPQALAARDGRGNPDDGGGRLRDAGFEHVLAVMSPERAKATTKTRTR